MSTRAMYTFKGNDDELNSVVHVYKHHDGYPEGALSWISNARQYAWEQPRFEADDFAAAFVVANKKSGGDIRLCGVGITEPYHMAGDAAFHYVVTFDNNSGLLHVQINEVSWWNAEEDGTNAKSEEIFNGTLDKAIKKFGADFLTNEKETEAA